ncbi:MAG: polysaccharide biosynthesis tyrosine autokinase [Mariprofundaceae bacterium]|nr:polysaccharide biosynthesis tyrosine autokinase [Mariprofundaceae bacterium]
MAQASEAMSGYELNLEEYWQIILRRRWIIIFCAISIGIFSGLFTWLNQPPPLYRSSASIKIEPKLDINALFMGRNASRSYGGMGTQLALIQSYALLERVGQHMGLIPQELSSAEIRANPDYVDIILDLKGSVNATQDGDTGIIDISVVSGSAAYARDLAQAVADEFQTFNIEDKNKKVFEAKKFIEQQMLVVGGRLKEAEEKVRNYRQKNNLSSTTENGADVVGNIVSDLEKIYQQSVSHLNDLQFLLKELRLRLQQVGWDYKAVSAPAKVSEYFGLLNQRLVELALKRTELSTNYTDEHPQIRELSLQAEDILLSMVDELAKQVSLTQRRMKDVQQSIQDAQQKYRGVPEQALELQRLQRSVTSNEALFILLEKKYQEVLIKESEKVQEVSQMRPAMLSSVRINPIKVSQAAMAGIILGLVLGLIVALIFETMDMSMGTIEEVEHFLETPVVGFVPHLSHDEAVELFSGEKDLVTKGVGMERQLRLVSHFSPPSIIAESYRSLRTNLLFSQAGEKRVILITSATVKEGKSTIAANLSVVIAQQGGRVLLVDGDMRKPMLHYTFGLKRSPGLGEVLLGQRSWQDTVSRFADIMLGDMGIDQALMTPGLDQLDILTCGRASANPPDLLASPLMNEMLTEVREAYDVVIIDMPPLLHTTDATVISAKVDGVLLVYHVGSVVRGALKRVKNNIENVGGRVLGVALNSVRGDISPDYSNYKMDQHYVYAYGENEIQKKGWFKRAVRTLKKAFRFTADYFRKER